MIETMWPGGQQPVTQVPVIDMRDQQVLITSATPGASVAYRIEEQDFAAKLFGGSGAWQLYRQPSLRRPWVRCDRGQGSALWIRGKFRGHFRYSGS